RRSSLAMSCAPISPSTAPKAFRRPLEPRGEARRISEPRHECRGLRRTLSHLLREPRSLSRGLDAFNAILIHCARLAKCPSTCESGGYQFYWADERCRLRCSRVRVCGPALQRKAATLLRREQQAAQELSRLAALRGTSIRVAAAP